MVAAEEVDLIVRGGIGDGTDDGIGDDMESESSSSPSSPIRRLSFEIERDVGSGGGGGRERGGEGGGGRRWCPEAEGGGGGRGSGESPSGNEEEESSFDSLSPGEEGREMDRESGEKPSLVKVGKSFG